MEFILVLLVLIAIVVVLLDIKILIDFVRYDKENRE